MAGVCESELGIRHVAVQVRFVKSDHGETCWQNQVVPRHAAIVSGFVDEVHVRCKSFSCSVLMLPCASKFIQVSLGLAQSDMLPNFDFSSTFCVSMLSHDGICLSFSLHTNHSVLVDTTTLKDGALYILFSYTIHEACISETYFQISNTFCHVHVAFLLDWYWGCRDYLNASSYWLWTVDSKTRTLGTRWGHLSSIIGQDQSTRVLQEWFDSRCNTRLSSIGCNAASRWHYDHDLDDYAALSDNMLSYICYFVDRTSE